MQFARSVGSRAKEKPIWSVRVTVRSDLVPGVEQILDDQVVSLSHFETDQQDLVAVEACMTEEPDEAALSTQIALLAAAAGLASPIMEVDQLPQTDWLSASYAAFPPLQIGRFCIYGSHETGKVPASQIGLCIDAATAFGSGEHATTKGCLLAIDRIAKARRPRKILDMGCGTGILAFAAARRMGRDVLAADIDPESVRVARLNTRVNRLKGRVRTLLSAGYSNPAIASSGPYDLIVANILARPLCQMAADLRRHLAPGGLAILAGLLDRQEAQVMAAHRAQGLALSARIRVGVWPTLILRAGAH
ncbi:MAG: 50S ribosomal protein L11 methyltransferase [Pseudomonadota bacterium]